MLWIYGNGRVLLHSGCVTDPPQCGILRDDRNMTLKQLFVAAPAVLLIFGGGVANAGQTINDEGPTVCASTSGTSLSLRRDTS